jgi:hypothetical protein
MYIEGIRTSDRGFRLRLQLPLATSIEDCPVVFTHH